MKPRQQRMLTLGLVFLGISVATMLALTAFEQSMMFFVEISEIKKGEYPKDKRFRVGGLVVDNSVIRKSGQLLVEFQLTDLSEDLVVRYEGILPDLFREGQGIIAHGQLNNQGVFLADEVLAKHDEKYMPPEIADSLLDAANQKKPQANEVLLK